VLLEKGYLQELQYLVSNCAKGIYSQTLNSLKYSKQLAIKQKYNTFTWFSIYDVIKTCTLLGDDSWR
jgi:hypothetical protein